MIGDSNVGLRKSVRREKGERKSMQEILALICNCRCRRQHAKVAKLECVGYHCVLNDHRTVDDASCFAVAYLDLCPWSRTGWNLPMVVLHR
jgi:hypothetical protein